MSRVDPEARQAPAPLVSGIAGSGVLTVADVAGHAARIAVVTVDPAIAVSRRPGRR
ncbi:hypothetical protein [Gryllotalpicola sp.]|uniref:hypothetical protein n=1 Tax=Gryllotalpicola sp. TaxID=1932787 RepID=UPI0026058388|nr:hypothetical protein [Gryllotalpicola sp.]